MDEMTWVLDGDEEYTRMMLDKLSELCGDLEMSEEARVRFGLLDDDDF